MEDQQDQNNRQDPIVTSGESDEGMLDSSDDDDDDDNNNNNDAEQDQQQQKHQGTKTTNRNNDDGDDVDHTGDIFYDENADREDEAYVYNVLRSGSADPTNNGSSQEKVSVTKPRNSDAVLSCPCCLSIVCMDCQRHERHKNQYRAMFVMNIVVRWDIKLRHDAEHGQLIPFEESHPVPSSIIKDAGSTTSTGISNNHRVERSATARIVVEDHPDNNQQQQQDDNDEDDVYYYKVCCANCQTQVASLDMTDEVYHFYGCVASA